MFKLDQIKDREKLAEQVQFLLEDDHFLCPEENYEVRTIYKVHTAFAMANMALRAVNFAFWLWLLWKPCSRNILRGANRVEDGTVPNG